MNKIEPTQADRDAAHKPDCEHPRSPVKICGCPAALASEPLMEQMAEALARQIVGWENVVELDLLPPQHRDTARTLADDARATLTAYWTNKGVAL